MKLIFLKRLIIILVINLPINLSAAIENKIIATIGEEIITSFDLKNKILSSIILSDEEVSQSNINKLKKISLEYLIDYKLKKIEISKYESSDMNNRFNNYLLNISNNNTERFKNIFKENNLDFDSYKDQIITEFKWRELVFKKFNKRININENDIDSEVRNIIKNKKKITEYKLAEIEILIDGNESSNYKIENLNKKIKEIGFEETAKNLSISPSASNGGNLGWLNENILSKKIFKYVKNLNIGEISEIIMENNRATLLKLVDKRSSEIKDLDIKKIKIDLIDKKKNEMFALYSSSFLSKLKNSTLIEYK